MWAESAFSGAQDLLRSRLDGPIHQDSPSLDPATAPSCNSDLDLSLPIEPQEAGYQFTPMAPHQDLFLTHAYTGQPHPAHGQQYFFEQPRVSGEAADLGPTAEDGDPEQDGAYASADLSDRYEFTKNGEKRKRKPWKVWTEEENQQLVDLVSQAPPGKAIRWSVIARRVGDGTRQPSQCRERWSRVLDPRISKLPWSTEELLQLHRHICDYSTNHGRLPWAQIAKHMDGRTDIQCRYQHTSGKVAKAVEDSAAEATRGEPPAAAKRDRDIDDDHEAASARQRDRL